MKKILCFRNSRLGDFLVSLPTLNLIKKINKDCKIYYLSDKSILYKSLPKYLGKKKLVDKFIFYENNILSFIKLFFLLRSLKFDTIYYIREKPNIFRELRDYIFFFLLNIKNRKGFFINRKDYKIYNETTQITQRINEKITSTEVKYLSKIQLTKTKPLLNYEYITISIGGFSQPKIWKKNYWSIFLRLIVNKSNLKIVIIGTNKDIKIANSLSLINKKKIISMCGKTNISELFNLIRFSKIHITNDNGSMHVASLFEKKTICLFNNHDPKGKWNPINKNAIVLRNEFGINEIKPIKVFNNFLRIS